MTKVYDLGKEGHGFVPLPVTPTHRGSLRAAVLGAVKAIPGANRQVLSTYSQKRTEWDIPPMYCGEFRGIGLQVSIDVSNSRGLDPYTEYLEVLDQFRKNGWGGRTKRMLEGRLGQLATHPHVFDKSSDDIRQFAGEYAMAISRRYRRGLILQGSTALVRVPTREGWADIGLVDGGLPQYPDVPAMRPNEIFDFLLQPRGVVITQRFGAYDRVLRWAEENFGVIEQVDELRLALTLLKLSCKDEEEWAFEDSLRYNAEVAVIDRGPNPYTDEALDLVRAAWFDTEEGGNEGAFQKLFEAVCPTYIDSVVFKRMFGALPKLDEVLTSKQVSRIDRGISKFALNFMDRARRHSSGR